MNISDTERYQAWRAEQDFLFAPEYRDPKSDETIEFENGYSVHTKGYKRDEEMYILLTASENELLDNAGHVLYTWRNLDTDSAFCTLFEHQNGKHYLIFRIEFYGYSVFEAESGKVMHYVPSVVHPEKDQEMHEVYIWTGANYDPDSNLLAVSGCLWGGYWSVIVIDFTRPLLEQPAEQWLDVKELIDPDHEIYDDMDFVCWEKGALLLRCEPVDLSRSEEIRLPLLQLKTHLKHK